MRRRAHLHDFRGASGGRSGAEVDVDVRAMEVGQRRTVAVAMGRLRLSSVRGEVGVNGTIRVLYHRPRLYPNPSKMLCPPPSRLESASAEVLYRE
jgi:hypothetical protein